MKSAYERAMERMGGTPTPTLTAKQKEAIAEINRKHEAKIAERKTFLEGQIRAARMAGQPEEAAELDDQLRRDLAAIHDDWERAKKKIWGDS